MKNRSTALRVLLAGTALCALLSGCGAKDKAPGQAQQSPAVQAPAKASGEAPAVQPKSAAIQAYFGDENGTALIARPITITYAADADKYSAALAALQKSPDNKVISLFEGFKFNKTTVQQGKASVDVKLEPAGRLGSGGEALVLEALQKALFQFPEINEIYVTVDGKQTDSLMGHLELPYPIKRK